MSSVKKAVVLSSVTALLSKFISFFSVILVARLLSPEEIGIHIIAASIMMLTSEISTLGTNNYIIREKNLTIEKQQSCLALAIMMSWGLAFIILACSPFISDFYEINDLILLIAILSSSFFLNPFISMTITILTRDFQFGRIMTIQVTGSVVSFIITILMIYLDYSYFSMAIGEASGAVIKFALAFILKPENTTWLPKIGHLKPILSVGIYTSLLNILARFEFSISDLILGKLGSSTIVATTSRAIGLFSFIRDVLGTGISRVASPYLATNYQSQKTLKISFLKSNDLSMAFMAPPLAVAGVAAEALITLLFGEQWLASVATAQILTIWIVIKSMTSFSNNVLIIAHAEKQLLFIRAVAMASLGLMIYVCVSLLNINIGFAFIFFAIINLILSVLLLRKVLALSVVEFFMSIYKSVTLTIICTVAAIGVNMFITARGVGYILGMMVFMSIIYLLCLKLIKHPLLEHLVELYPKAGKKNH